MGKKRKEFRVPNGLTKLSGTPDRQELSRLHQAFGFVWAELVRLIGPNKAMKLAAKCPPLARIVVDGFFGFSGTTLEAAVRDMMRTYKKSVAQQRFAHAARKRSSCVARPS